MLNRSGAPVDAAPGPDEVHVWRARLGVGTELERLRRTLTADERARAGRYRFARDRDRFVAARGLLRSILAASADGDPARLRFDYGPQGKPALVPTPDDGGLRFNVSHAGDLLLVAVGRGRELGVDVEAVRPDLAIDAIAARLFTPWERAALASLPPVRRHDAFFAIWTHKEAYVKAVGGGLSVPLDRVEVAFGPNDGATVRFLDDPAESDRWTVRSLAPAPGYAAALAVEGRGWRPVWRQWPGGDHDPGDRPPKRENPRPRGPS